ncbi:MAG: winged helix-turn-helix transcriptional regulator [Hyphomonadaceae bacterium]|nr:MAG: MarR family transcriptional regulator [Caulobacteraceae bacterium]MBT9446448.1 winged helix-turn-helix transcriptional regulator [Hyphomonadaceae bacterium]TPW05317.1 MAG: MarR family transcriptional regulator [Alphaproteobacteria bacterium]
MSSATTRRSSRRQEIRPEADDQLRLEAFLPYRLAVLANAVSRAFARRYEDEFGLSIPEWRVMALLAVSPGLTATEVAEATPMDKVAVSRAVRGLIEAGRLRASADKTDARRQRLALTPAGMAIYRRIVPLARALEARLTAGMGTDEREALDRLLAQLEAAARTL